MNIYKELVTHEVFPALGCTEPIAVAYAAAIAAAQLEGEVNEVRIEVDPGVFKNGFAVTVPNTGGGEGKSNCWRPGRSHRPARSEDGDPEGD